MLNEYIPNKLKESPETENPVSSTAAILSANWLHIKVINKGGGGGR